MNLSECRRNFRSFCHNSRACDGQTDGRGGDAENARMEKARLENAGTSFLWYGSFADACRYTSIVAYKNQHRAVGTRQYFEQMRCA